MCGKESKCVYVRERARARERKRVCGMYACVYVCAPMIEQMCKRLGLSETGPPA